MIAPEIFFLRPIDSGQKDVLGAKFPLTPKPSSVEIDRRRERVGSYWLGWGGGIEANAGTDARRSATVRKRFCKG